MAVTMVVDATAQFDAALANFYVAASNAITIYVMPIAWVLLAISLLVHTWAIFEGKVSSPLQDWMFKMVTAIMVLYAMSGGYLNWIGLPLIGLGDALTAAVTGNTGKAVLTALTDRVIDLVSLIFVAAGDAFKGLAWRSAILLVVFGVLVAVVSFILIALAIFHLIYAKVGMSLLISVGPFFMLGLLNQHTRSYFFAWLSAAFYFVFYQVLTVLFIVLFLDIITSYINALITALGGVAFNIMTAIENLLGVGDATINVVATILPLLAISLAMFFMLMQVPQIAASITSGSGGAFGSNLYYLSNIMRGGYGGQGRNEGSNQNHEKNRVQLRPKKN